MTDFLDMKVDDVKEPELLPVGAYAAVITNYKVDKTSSDDPKDFVRFTFKATRPLDDDAEVTVEELEDGNKFRRVDSTFWLTDNAIVILKRFLTKQLGLDPSEMTFREMFEESLGYEVGILVTHDLAGKNKDIPVANVDRFVPIEE